MWGHRSGIWRTLLYEMGCAFLFLLARHRRTARNLLASGILEPGTEFKLAHRESPREGSQSSSGTGPDAGFAELLYLKDLSAGWYAVLDPKKTKSVFGLSWPKKFYRICWFWLVYGKAPGYPMVGSDLLYCIGTLDKYSQ